MSGLAISQNWFRRFLKVARRVIGSSEKNFRLLYFIKTSQKPRLGVMDGCLKFETPLMEFSGDIRRSFAIPMDPLIFLLNGGDDEIIFELENGSISIRHRNEILKMKILEKQFPKIPSKPKIWLDENLKISELVKSFDGSSAVCDEDSEIHFLTRFDSSFVVGNDGNHIVFSQMKLSGFTGYPSFLYRLPYVSVRHLVKTLKFIKVKRIKFGLGEDGLQFELGNSSMSICGETEDEWRKREFENFMEENVFTDGKFLFSVDREIFRYALGKMGRFLRSRNRMMVCEYSRGNLRMFSEEDNTRYSITLKVKDGEMVDREILFSASPKKLLSLMERFQSKELGFFSMGECVKMRRSKGDIQIFLRKLGRTKPWW